MKINLSTVLANMSVITEAPDMKNADFSGWDLSNLETLDGIDWSKFETSTVRPAHEVMGMTEAEFAAFVAMKRKEVGMSNQQIDDFILSVLIGVMTGCLTAIVILVALG